ncbi:hypothetical protein OEB96_01295 [Paraliomyxa miuraensis]|nr:hypothetical protein [Paraliomyxa miuraensis]
MIACLFAMPACVSRYEVDTTSPAYAADAQISVRVTKTGIRELRIEIENLAPPARIDPSLHAYVVWISVPGYGITKAGVLDYDQEDRSGRLTATTPHSKFEVLVSLESNPAASEPSQQIVLRKLLERT